MSVALPDIHIATLNQRHHAAWLEHGARMAQRQNAVQIFIGSSIVVFGFALQEPTALSGKVYTVRSWVVGVGIPVLALFAGSLIALHNAVILRLVDYMKGIENFLSESIEAPQQRYFSIATTGRVAPGHARHRFWHRVLLASIIFITNLSAVLLSALEFGAYGLLWINIPLSVFSTAILFHGVNWSRR